MLGLAGGERCEAVYQSTDPRPYPCGWRYRRYTAPMPFGAFFGWGDDVEDERPRRRVNHAAKARNRRRNKAARKARRHA